MCSFPCCPGGVYEKLKLTAKLLCIRFRNAVVILPERNDVVMERKGDFQIVEVEPWLKQKTRVHQLRLSEAYRRHEMMGIPLEARDPSRQEMGDVAVFEFDMAIRIKIEEILAE